MFVYIAHLVFGVAYSLCCIVLDRFTF